ncbi:hypothetical protein [Methylobacterium dankookense]|uniref:TonB C-terminal domain-containing protein n=1 Tax=Methylobacterium dankookense TaxID=560405 RepID=A0A564G758_9HYPH|nr:hypothetical protein [Methylobacterium dankookense]GJD55779.1 hypothetical protein IFDJLNFL_1666 [Methylobacterium dankookense]VUF15856.1 hypothetical protein MTDSW087_05604 [Methylobacterium dankookense]
MGRLLGGIERARWGAALLLAIGLTSAAQAEPASTLRDMWGALGTCTGRIRVPQEASGSEVTVLFTMRRDGSLQGRPRITHSRLVGDEAARRDFVAAALAALAACFPLPITEGLGGAVAGRPIRYRITSGTRGA